LGVEHRSLERMPDLYVIIMAGGASSRFWPLSGDAHPKYLLKPDGDTTLIESAWRRATMCTDAARVLVVTGGVQAHLVREALPGLDPSNLCVEPARRDTAAAIALGCRRVRELDAGADVLVMPADTLLEPPGALADGVKDARSREGFADHVHVFGVTPAYPEGGFGYIEPGDTVGGAICAVKTFKEKPGKEVAAAFMQQGMLWNIGCFLFNLPTFDEALHRHLPQHSARLLKTADKPSESDYTQLDSISIDYGLIEKLEHLRVVRLQAEFDDIGTWDALLARLEKSGRTAQEAFSIGGQDNHAAGEATTVAVVGESNLLVVVSEGKVLVLKKGHGQEVKRVSREPRL
jgi:mannose-1-phosphate guanylyltransferase